MKRQFTVPTLVLLLGLACIAAKVHGGKGLTQLKHELTSAQKELTQAEARVLELEEAIAQKEIQRIQEQIGKIEEGELAALLHSREQRLAFFSKQRETLSHIIRKHPVCAMEAQAVLDQILTLITHIADEIID